MTHNLFKTGDQFVPKAICDRNGEVVLGMCKDCGKGEVELEGPCDRMYVKTEHGDHYVPFVILDGVKTPKKDGWRFFEVLGGVWYGNLDV